MDFIISSKELGRRYGEPAVFITFEVGEGRIYHMISHFYLQRTETRTARHGSSSDEYLKEKKISAAMMAKYKGMGSTEASLSEVESAYLSSSALSRVMLEKKEQVRRWRKAQERHPGPEKDS